MKNMIIDKESLKNYMGNAVSKKRKNPWHQNIYGLRSCNIDYVHSHEELLEYAKCYKDPVYFAETYCMCPSYIDDSNTIIKLREYQKEYLNSLIDEQPSICISDRQMGCTLVMDISILWKIIFMSNKKIVKQQRFTHYALDNIRNMYIQLPFYMQVGVSKIAKTEIIFGNGMELHSRLEYKRGIDPVKFFENVEYNIDNDQSKNINSILEHTTYHQITPRMNIINSGPYDDNIRRIAFEASRNINGFKLIKLPWDLIRQRDLDWHDEQVKMRGNDSEFI